MNDATHTPAPAKQPTKNSDISAADVGAVVIGRNEGKRLESCFASLRGRVSRVVYVDSGSTDGSIAAARTEGAVVIELERTLPFTAARARNSGLSVLTDGTAPRYIQFVDGDCALDQYWVGTASQFLDANPTVAVVYGRRRERFPEASIYNRLCDWEWDTPIGRVGACGGDAMFRTSAILAVGGYRDSLIAGEEPELCLRLGRAGWEVWRLDAEMTLHDAAIHRFAQWWRRSHRGGYAFAEGAALHGAAPERHWVAETRRALAWSILPPAIAAALAPLGAAGLLVLLAYPVQIARLAARSGVSRRSSWERASFTVLAKFPEALGVLEFWLMRLKGGRTLIEYK